jgi:Uma2 family endonuclease
MRAVIKNKSHFSAKTRHSKVSCTEKALYTRLTSFNHADVVYIPDLMVVCGKKGVEEDYISAPKVVVEVLSRSTQIIDRREKLLSYMQIPSVEEYLVVSQRNIEVTIHRRAKNFLGERFRDREASVEIASLQLSVPLAEIYEDVD